MHKPQKVEIDIKLLQRIADYYEFPMTAFLTTRKIFKHTRRKNLRLKVKKFKEGITKITNKFMEEI